MPARPKQTLEPLGSPQSVRVQIYSHELLKEKDSQPLASFRLRSSSSSTFADLAASVIDRYERSKPGGSSSTSRVEVGAILDEQDCSFDMSDAIDIIQPNEFIRFVLAKPADAEKTVSSKNAEQTRSGLGDRLAWPTAYSITNSVTKGDHDVPDTTVPGCEEQPQLPPARQGSSDPIEVDATGTPIHSRLRDDSVEITGATSMGLLSGSSQAPSSPTCRLAVKIPVVKSSARQISKPAKKVKSVLQQIQDSNTGRQPGTLALDAGTNRNPDTAQLTTSFAVTTAVQPRPTNQSASETPLQRQTRVALSTGGSMQATKDRNQGRKDPYEIPSDGEEISTPIRRPSNVPPGSGIGSMKRIKQEPKSTMKSIQPPISEPIRSNATPSTPAGQVTAPIAMKTPASQRRTPKPIPPDAEIISVQDSSNTNETRRQALERIAEGAKTISLSDSHSQSDEVDDQGLQGVAMPDQPSKKALGKRSHHSVNGHVNIVEQHQHQPQAPSYTPQPIMLCHARGVTPVYRKGEASSSPMGSSASSKASSPAMPPRRSTQSTAQAEEKSQNKAVGSVEPANESNMERARTVTRSSMPPEMAIKHAKSKMEVKFGKKATTRPIPDSFFADHNLSDANYKSCSSDKGDDSADESVSSATSIKPCKRRPITASHNAGRSRSSSQSSSKTAITPINTLKSKIQEKEPIQPASRFHRGYPKHLRDRFSDASDSSDPEDEESSGDDATSQSNEIMGRKPWWSPMGWIMKFETTFRSPTQDIANGPFKGYIPFGPNAGTYLPGYGPPSDEELAKAEKTAVLKGTFFDGTSEDSTSACSDVDDDLSSAAGENAEDGPISEEDEPSKANSNRDSSETSNDSHNLAGAERCDGDIKPHPSKVNEVPNSQSPESSASSLKENEEDAPFPLKDRTAERAERIKRTVHNGSDSPVQRLPVNLAPATVPADNSPPTSVDSERYPAMIETQLTQETPPSNQQLAALLSPSPARASNQKMNVRTKLTASRDLASVDHDDLTVSSTEPSSGIPACLPPRTPQKEQQSMPNTPQRVPEAPLLENPSPQADFILNGIGRRRSTRSMTFGSSATRPNYRIPGLDEDISTLTKASEISPSKSSKKVAAIPKDTDTSPSAAEATLPTGAAISVELPLIPMEKQAEYEAVSPERSSVGPPYPLKSFDEFSEVSAGTSTSESHGASQDALDYVLRESPNWLNDITQVDPDSSKLLGPNAMEGRRSLVSTSRAQRSSVADINHDPIPIPEQDFSTQLQRPIMSEPLPITSTLDDEGVSQATPRSKKRKRASTAIEDMPLSSESPASKKTKKHRTGDKKHKLEAMPDREQSQGQKLAATAEDPPANANDLDNNDVEDGDNGTPSKKRSQSKKEGKKRKHEERNQTTQPSNEEVDTNIGSNGLDDSNNLDEDRREPPKKKKEVEKNQKGPPTDIDSFPRLLPPLQQQRQQQQQQQHRPINRKQRVRIRQQQKREANPDLESAAALDQTGNNNQNTTMSKSKSKNHDAITTSNDDGAFGPSPHIHKPGSAMGFKIGRWRGERGRVIITPPATSRPSSPESMRT